MKKKVFFSIPYLTWFFGFSPNNRYFALSVSYVRTCGDTVQFGSVQISPIQHQNVCLILITETKHHIKNQYLILAKNAKSVIQLLQ